MLRLMLFFRIKTVMKNHRNPSAVFLSRALSRVASERRDGGWEIFIKI